MIHSTAILHKSALIGANVKVGPYAVVGANVELGDGCRLGPHSVVEGSTRIGAGTTIGPHAVLGLPPQDVGYRGEPTCLEIGEKNIIREFVTINRGSAKPNGFTLIGSENYLMAYCHVAHDCRVGNHIVMANGATLGGHVKVGDFANLGGLCAVHQFARVGEYAMLGGGTIATMDIPPYVMAAGNHARLFGINRHGLRRNGFDSNVLRQLQRAYRVLFQSGLRFREAAEQIENDATLDAVPIKRLLAFMRNSHRGVTR